MFDISKPHWFCPSSDWRLSRLPTRPITTPANGNSMNTNSVNCHEISNIMVRHTIIITGFLNIISNDAIIEFSISATSPLMRAITSPLRSVVKKPMGNVVILL